MMGYLVAGVLAMAEPVTLPMMHVLQQGQVEGEVMQVFSTAIVIKNEQGHGTVLQITPRTQLGTQFKPGDKIIAYVTPYGVSSIQLKTNTALMP
jgi:translation initiation factor IF-1